MSITAKKLLRKHMLSFVELDILLFTAEKETKLLRKHKPRFVELNSPCTSLQQNYFGSISPSFVELNSPVLHRNKTTSEA